MLIILRMLPRRRIDEMLQIGGRSWLVRVVGGVRRRGFGNASDSLAARRPSKDLLLIGINCRDLQTLEVVQERFAGLVSQLPQGLARGRRERCDHRSRRAQMRRLGYRAGIDRHRVDGREDPLLSSRKSSLPTRTVHS